MTSSFPQLSLASGAARAKYIESAYFNNLRLSASLAVKEDEMARDFAGRKKIGAPSMDPLDLYKSTEEKLADNALNRETAVNDLKAVLPRKQDASSFVNSLSTQVDPASGLSELTMFNRFFPAFSKEVLSVANPALLTPDYISQLWNSFKVVAEYLQTSGVPGAPKNFRDPNAAIQFKRLLDQEASVIKTIATTIPGITPAQLNQLENDVDDAVTLEDLPRIQEIGRRVRQAISAAPSASAPSIAPSSTPSIAPGTPYTPVPKVAAATDFKEYETELMGLIGPYSNTKDLIKRFVDISKGPSVDKDNAIKAITRFVTKTFDAAEAKIAADKDWADIYIKTMVLLEILRAGAVFDTSNINIAKNAISSLPSKSPAKIRATLGPLLSLIPSPGSSPAPTPPPKGKGKKKGSGRRTSAGGSGINEKVMLGELLAGNDSRALRRRAIEMLRSGARI